MKKNKLDLSKIEQLYTGNISQFGIDSRSVGWKSAESQEMRFSKLMDVVHDPRTPFTINELGCGYGELVKYLESHTFQYTQYNGFDISDKMLEHARGYVPGPNNAFLHADSITTKADYSVTSGIFNVAFDERKETWEDYIKDTLRNMNEFSTKGFSFNLLSSYVDYEDKNLYYANPAGFFDFCKREFSKQVRLMHDYPLYEWTILVDKTLG